MKVFALAGCVALMSCVSNQDQFSNSKEIKTSGGESAGLVSVAAKELSFQTQSNVKLEAYSCIVSKGAPFVLVLNAEPVSSANACKDSFSQGFLAAQKNVISLNRPGTGHSGGEDKFGDAQSVAQVLEFAKKEQAEGIVWDGVAGYGVASVLTFNLARAQPWSFVLVGNGIYDWEQLLVGSQDPEFVAQLKKAQGQDATFAEQRSIAWDFNGLPKRVLLYHVKNDKRFPEAPAEAFRGTLAANQYDVQLVAITADEAKGPFVEHGIAVRQLVEAKQ